jgi:branched-chain amino acid transport system substrate-binding protein
MGKPKILVLAAFASLLLTACGASSSGGAASNKPTTVKIAAEGPFTGDEASIGAGALKGIQLAVDDFNKAGGVNGTNVQVVVYDDQHSASVATTQEAQGISDTTVLGIVGPMNSSVVEGVEPGLQGASPPLPFVSESASATKVTDSGFSVAHRVCGRDDVQGPSDARFMIDQGAKKVEVIDSATDYSRPLAQAVVSYLQSKGSGIQTQQDSAPNGTTNFSTIVTKIHSFNADWVYYADEGQDVAPLVLQLKSSGYTIGQNIQFLGSDGTEDASIITKSQGAYDGAYATNVAADPNGSPSSAAADMVNRYKAANGPDSLSSAGPFYGSAYQATQVLLQAIKASPVNNGKISRADVLSHLNSDTFDTIFGSVKFNSRGDVTAGGIYVYQAKGSSMVVVKQITGV